MIISLIILLAIYVNTKLPKGNRTWLMAFTNVPTVIGFAMIAWCKSKGARLAGYCEFRGFFPLTVLTWDKG